ncbi:MAG: DoxX family protein [Candidatus Didemnitutus sp.]|nr:DoxX family protein [Candidatus Didemnitutus sp.]
MSAPRVSRFTTGLRRALHCQGAPARLGPRLRTPFLFGLRLATGGHFLVDGLTRFGDLAGGARLYGGLGIPLPWAYALIAAGVGTVGGLALALGWQTTRATAALLFLLLLVQLAREPEVLRTLLAANPAPWLGSRQFPVFFATAVLWIFGPGRWSLDARQLTKNSDVGE